MEYLLIIAFQVVGILFDVMKKVIALGNNNKDKKRKEIISIFFSEDWDTLCVSGLILITTILVHFTVDYFFPGILNSSISIPGITIKISYLALAFITSFFLGLGGQSYVYKWLGSAQKAIDSKVENILK